MTQFNRRDVLTAMAGLVGGSTLSSSVAAAEEPGKAKSAGTSATEFKIPASLKAEHEELHEELVRATKVGGKTADAAKAVAKVLHSHFVKEEELAMPALGLLRPLAEGPVRPEMAKITELTDQLKKELPTMLKEHEAVVRALDVLIEAAKVERQTQAQQFAENLKKHAKVEEDITYPAAILVGEFIKLKLGK